MILEVEPSKNRSTILIKLNPQIYDLQVIYATCYAFLERAFVKLDGNPKKSIIVELTPKKDLDVTLLEKEFNNELIKFGFYQKQHEKTAGIKTLMLKRALALSDEVAKIYIEKDRPKKN